MSALPLFPAVVSTCPAPIQQQFHRAHQKQWLSYQRGLNPHGLPRRPGTDIPHGQGFHLRALGKWAGFQVCILNGPMGQKAAPAIGPKIFIPMVNGIFIGQFNNGSLLTGQGFF